MGEILSQLPTPGAGDRVAIMGNSGEGKSLLLIRLLQSCPNVILVNTKDDPAFNVIGPRIAKDADIYKYTEGRVNWVPSDEWQESMELKDRFFLWAMKHARANDFAGRDAGLVVAIDEVNDICPQAQVYPRKFQKAVKQGRFIGLGIWCGAQEPVRCPSFSFGQAQHRYLFFIGWDAHRKVAEAWFEQRIAWDEIGERSHRFLLKTPKGVYGPQPPIALK